MLRILKQLTVFLLCAIIMSFAFTVSAADRTSFSYTYDSNGNSQGVPVPYISGGTISGAEKFGNIGLKSPTDFFVYNDELIFILDSGNNRIAVLDDKYDFVDSIYICENGKQVLFEEAVGIFVNAENIYIADKSKATVYVCDRKGNIIRSIGAPPADKVEADFVYAPTHVLAGTDGVVYIISANTYSGALQYDADGTFLGFFGSDTIEPTLKVRLNQIWKKLLSKEAAAGLQRNVPISFVQFDIDSKNFIYTVRGGTGSGSGQIRRVNPNGVNVLLDGDGNVATYGDLETYFDTKTNQTVSTTFTDVTVDDGGFITLIDSTRNRLFQYDGNTNLLFTFAGAGTQSGTFVTPVAVENMQGSILVLDSGIPGVHIFNTTDFGLGVRTAISLYNDGLYEDVAKYWEYILSCDAYYELANTGMGKVYERTGDYDLAMEYYRNGNDKQGYSSAFAAKRDAFTRDNFLWILIAVTAALLAIVAYTVYRERHPVNDYDVLLSKGKMPVRCLLHPFKGFGELRQKNWHSPSAAGIILLIWFFVTVISTQLTSFHFNGVSSEEFNVFAVLAKTLGIYVLFVLCNWAVSTLADGRGRLLEIACYTAYALTPYIITKALLIIASNLLSLEEAAFYGIINTVGLLCTAIYLYIALKEVHEYSGAKTVLTVTASVIGMYFIILIITVVYSMFAQLLSFFTMLYSEIRLK